MYFVFRPDSLIRSRAAARRRDDARAGLGDGQLDPALLAGGVADGRADQLEEVPLDPFACEVVGHGEHERVVRDLHPSTSPNHVRYVESLSAPLSRPATSVQSSLRSAQSVDPPGAPHSSSRQRAAEHSNVRTALQWPPGTQAFGEKRAFAGISSIPTRLSTAVDRLRLEGCCPLRKHLSARPFHSRIVHIVGVENGLEEPRLYWAVRGSPAAVFMFRRTSR